MFVESVKQLRKQVKQLRKQGVSDDVLLLVDEQITRATWFREHSKQQEDDAHKAHTYKTAVSEICFAKTLVSHIQKVYL